MSNYQQIAETALGLSLDERAALANQLLASLEGESAEDNERLWTEECLRRVAAYRSGTAASVSAEEVHRKAAALFR